MRFCQVALLLIFACFISCNPPSNKVSNQEIRDEPWHVRLEQIATGIENPVFLTHANDGSGRLFVILQEGKVLIMKGGSIFSEPFLDITEEVEDLAGGFSEMGLLGFAFHPDYIQNSKVYAFYSHTKLDDNTGHIAHVSEFTVSKDNPDWIDPLSKRTIMEFNCTGFYVNGGHIEFGPDGLLYVGVGEGQKKGLAQNKDNGFGSILRIDVSQGEPYSIPSDNPWVSGVSPEVWAYGLRNPYRFAFDPETKLLICSDVGDLKKEEIDIIEKGGNYGWPDYEGTVISELPNLESHEVIPPLTEYDHQKGFGSAIVGSYVYRGRSFPNLRGKLIVADWSGDMFYRNDLEPGPLRKLIIDNLEDFAKPEREVEIVDGEEEIQPKYYTNSLAVDEDGELYMVGQRGIGLKGSGSVFRLKFSQEVEFTAAVN